MRSENFFVNHEWRPTNSNTVLYLSGKQIFAYCFSLNMDIQEALDVYLYNLRTFFVSFFIYFELMLSASCNILTKNRNSIHLIKQLPSRYFQWRRSAAFIVIFKQVLYIVMVFSLLKWMPARSLFCPTGAHLFRVSIKDTRATSMDHVLLSSLLTLKSYSSNSEIWAPVVRWCWHLLWSISKI